MKRPLAFWFVAAWCCVAMLIQASIYITRPMKSYQARGEPVPLLLHYLPLIFFVFLIWQMLGMVRLKPLNRWFAVVFFVSWALALAWNFTVVIRNQEAKLSRAIMLFSIIISLNLLSAWYLSRRRFREFAVQNVAEREKQMMQNASKKMMQKEISSTRK